MSQENVELARDLLEAFRQRDHERVFAFYDPAIVWDASAAREMVPDLAGPPVGPGSRRVVGVAGAMGRGGLEPPTNGL